MSDGRTVWRRGQDNAQRKKTWEEHKRLGLDVQLKEILRQVESAFGADQVDIIAIREKCQ